MRVFLSLPCLLVSNFKQIERKPTDYHTVFLHQLRVHSVQSEKPKILFAHTNTAVLVKLAPSAPGFRVTALTTIF